MSIHACSMTVRISIPMPVQYGSGIMHVDTHKRRLLWDGLSAEGETNSEDEICVLFQPMSGGMPQAQGVEAGHLQAPDLSFA